MRLKSTLLATAAAFGLLSQAASAHSAQAAGPELFPIQQVTFSGGGVANTMTITDASGTSETNYPLQFGRPFVQGAIPHAPAVLVNGASVPSQADVKNRYPDGSVEFAVIAAVIPAIPANGSVSLTFADTTSNSNTSLTSAQMEALLPIGRATMTLTPTSGPVGNADAGQMLADGNCKPWTSGPIAQTMECADDTAARKYDIGFGDGYHPFRPRFYVTFWPALGAISVRPEGENDLTTEIEDLAYNLSVTVGSTTKTVDLTGTQAVYPKKHWTTSDWILGPYWVGIATPQAMVNIDNNLRYLSSTRFMPNFDPQVQVPAATIASYYTNNWQGRPNDPFDGDWDGGSPDLGTHMGNAGESPWIAPFPQWATLWLYTGDWRMRQMALGIADGSGAFTGDMRETDPTRRFLRSDAVGSGTGLGRVVSIAGRPSMMNGVSGISCSTLASGVQNAGRAFCYGPGVGDFLPLITTSANIDGAGDPWSFPVFDHMADQYYPQYILTGDPWYLSQMYMWMGLELSGIYPNWGPNHPYVAGGRGPNGTYGNITDELRGEGWGIRTLAETAFAAPDGSPEKTYFTYLTNDTLGAWEGSLAVTGTPYDGTLPKTWASPLGDPECTTGTPPIHLWQCFGGASVTNNESFGILVPGAATAVGDPWMLSYVQYGLGRAAELGFAAKPLQQYTADFFLQGYAAIPQLGDYYELPDGGPNGLFTTWAQVIAATEPSYLTGVGWNAALGQSLPQQWASNQGAEGRHTELQPGMAMMVDQGITTWNWWNTNVYSQIAFATDPTWDIVPRTDNNVLPAQPTSTPP